MHTRRSVTRRVFWPAVAALLPISSVALPARAESSDPNSSIGTTLDLSAPDGRLRATISTDWQTIAGEQPSRRGPIQLDLPTGFDGETTAYSGAFSEVSKIPLVDEGGTVLDEFETVEWVGKTDGSHEALLTLVRSEHEREWKIASADLLHNGAAVAVGEPSEKFSDQFTLVEAARDEPGMYADDADDIEGPFDYIAGERADIKAQDVLADPDEERVVGADTFNAGTQRIDVLGVGLVNQNASASKYMTAARAISGILSAKSLANQAFDASSDPNNNDIDGVYLNIVAVVMIDKARTTHENDRNFIRDNAALNALGDDVGADLIAGMRYESFTNNFCGKATIKGRASVSRIDSGCNWTVLHEIGHNLNATHSSGHYHNNPVNRRTLMNISSSHARELRYANFYVDFTGHNVPSGAPITGTASYFISGWADNTSARRSPSSTSNGMYRELTEPERVLDTRDGTGGYNTAFGANTTRRVALTGIATPGDFNAVAINIAVLPTGSGSGYVQAAAGTNYLTSSHAKTVSHRGEVRSAGTIVKVDAAGAIHVKSTKPADIVIDVLGYFGSGDLKFTPRESDSANTTHVRAFDGNVSANANKPISIATACSNTPGQTAAVAVNITTVNMAGNGWLQASGTNPTFGAWSNINFVANDVTGNFSVVPVNTSNNQIVVMATKSGRVVVDVLGCFSTGSAKKYYPNAGPSRRLDWSPQGPHNTNRNRNVGSAEPTGSYAVGTVTVQNGSASMWMNVNNPFAPFPPSANINAGPSQWVSNTAIAEVNSSQQYRLRRSYRASTTTTRYDELGNFN